MFAMFFNCVNLKTINFGYINTSLVENMGFLFNGCINLKEIDLSNLITSKVTTLEWMFNNCSSLISIDISNFDTSKVTNFSSLFAHCSNLQKIYFGNIITSSLEDMERIFYECSSLKSIDLSNFDTSKVTSLLGFCFLCKNLETINFGNINTSSVENMRSFLYNCYNLKAVDLSNFDTSKVTTFQWMFLNCYSLKYLNLGHFNTTKITTIHKMFFYCKSLIYLNLYSFKLDNTVNITSAFDLINSNVKYCIKDYATKTYLIGADKISDCSDSCFQENKEKLDTSGNTCIKSCKDNRFSYDFNNLCFNECPNEAYILSCEGTECNSNPSECFIPEMRNYYLDLNDKKYKKCYEKCLYCYGNGDEAINNCIVCKDNYKLYKNLKNIKNCYPKCNNYYYFDKSNKYYCTDELKCPDKYKKFISDKNKCIDECKNDDKYKYAFNNKCYQKCPENTYTNKTYNYKCLYRLINNETITQRLIITSSDFQYVYECKREDTLNNNCKFLYIENESEIINIIQENINSIFDSEKGKSQVIKGENDTFYQLTNEKKEKELLKGDVLNNQNLTILDLGECGNLLKKIYNISDNDSLLYLKKENNSAKASEKDVQFLIFEPYNLTKLNLSYCKEEKVYIYIPLVLSEETRNTYENMK